jgi:hypothetical protein
MFIAGGVTGYLFGEFVAANDYMRAIIDRMTKIQFFSLVVAVMLAMIGLVLIIMSFNRKMFEAERDKRELDQSEFIEMKPKMRQSAFGLFAMAFSIGVLAWPFDPATGSALFRMALLTASIILQLVISIHLWRQYDELYRAVCLEGCTLSCALIATIIPIWAGASLFGYQVTFDPLAVILAINIFGFVPTLWLSIKRGLAK